MNSHTSSMSASPDPQRGRESQADVGNGAQMRLALTLGAQGMALSIEAAERRDPEFRAKAESAILRHLSACPGLQCSGEELVEVARLHAPCKDGRAFGAIFKSLAHRGLIRCLRSDLPRKYGNGTSGGRLWCLCQ